MASTKQNDAFGKDILQYNPLDCAIDWIKSNMEPEEVFSEEQLVQWATDNGYVLEDN